MSPSSPTVPPDNDNESYAEEQMAWYAPGRAKDPKPSSGTVMDSPKPNLFQAMIQKLQIGTTLAALVLFFLPWIDIRCSQQSIATQTGVQAIYGGGSASEGMKAFGDESGGKAPGEAIKDESMGYSILLALALLGVIGAVVVSFTALRTGDERQSNLVGILCAAAFVLISIQMMIGFPVKEELGRSMAEASKNESSGDPMGGLSDGMAGAVMMQIDVKHLPSLYFTLVMLGVPTLVLANSLLDRMRKG
jgi:hypothetical protein